MTEINRVPEEEVVKQEANYQAEYQQPYCVCHDCQSKYYVNSNLNPNQVLTLSYSGYGGQPATQQAYSAPTVPQQVVNNSIDGDSKLQQINLACEQVFIQLEKEREHKRRIQDKQRRLEQKRFKKKPATYEKSGYSKEHLKATISSQESATDEEKDLLNTKKKRQRQCPDEILPKYDDNYIFNLKNLIQEIKFDSESWQLNQYNHIDRAHIHILYVEGNFGDLINILNRIEMPNNLEDEIETFWNYVNYNLHPIKNKPIDLLTPVDRYRIRKKHESPTTKRIGDKKKYGFRHTNKEQLNLFYESDPKPSGKTKRELALKLGLRVSQVSNFFKNRRQRERKLMSIVLYTGGAQSYDSTVSFSLEDAECSQNVIISQASSSDSTQIVSYSEDYNNNQCLQYYGQMVPMSEEEGRMIDDALQIEEMKLHQQQQYQQQLQPQEQIYQTHYLEWSENEIGNYNPTYLTSY